MTALQHKLLRTIRTTLGQFLALVLVVIGGVSAYYGMNTAVTKLVEAQQNYYRETRFADYYFNVERAPMGIISQIREIPDVLVASGRIQKDIKVIRADGIYHTGRLTGFDPQSEINRLYLTAGRYFDDSSSSNDIEVLIDSQYAQAWSLNCGDSLQVIIDGRKHFLKIVGMARNPEFMYKIKNPLEFPDLDSMVVILMSEQQIRQITGMSGEINQVVVKMPPSANEAELKEKIGDILQPYGLTAGYPRRDQPSHKYVQSQVDTLVLAAELMPPGFFVVAMMMQFVLLRRLIKSQRLQIGIMKAVGYENHAIMIMFTEYSLAITTAGIVLGCFAGNALANMISGLFGQLLDMPIASSSTNWPVLLQVIWITTVVGLISGILASWEIIKINPAEAFHAEIPATNKQALIEQWSYLWKNTNSAWKMSLRSISRNRARFVSTMMGIAVTAGLILVALYFTNSRDFLITRHFEYENTYDCIARFDTLVKNSSIYGWTGWEEIKAIEPVLELPVIIKLPGSQGLNGKQKEETLVGMNSNQNLRAVFDKKGQRIYIPPEGILISVQVAKALNIKSGDQVIVQTKPGFGPIRSAGLLVRGINQQNIGATSLASLEQANHLLGGEGLINAAMISSSNPDLSKLEKRLIEVPGVDSVMRQDKQRVNAVRLMYGMNYFTVSMIIFAIFMGAAIVYNNSIMAFNERRRELASLKVIGWSNKNISSLLFNEILLATLLGVMIGLPAGKYIGGCYLQAISSETFTWPVVVYPETYVISLLVTAAFALAGHALSLQRVKELDLVEVLKDRE
ncbi:MAG: FtsX-like permease family protein [Syntrophomonas sp.]